MRHNIPMAGGCQARPCGAKSFNFSPADRKFESLGARQQLQNFPGNFISRTRN